MNDDDKKKKKKKDGSSNLDWPTSPTYCGGIHRQIVHENILHLDCIRVS